MTALQLPERLSVFLGHRLFLSVFMGFLVTDISQTLMLDEKDWLVVSTLIHPIGVCDRVSGPAAGEGWSSA